MPAPPPPTDEVNILEDGRREEEARERIRAMELSPPRVAVTPAGPPRIRRSILSTSAEVHEREVTWNCIIHDY